MFRTRFKTTKKKKGKVAKKKATKEVEKGAQKNGYNCDDEEEEEDEPITTVKTQLRKIIRPPYRNALIQAITEKALQATKICHLASLLFLTKVQEAYDLHNNEFFDKTNAGGYNVIKGCFDAVVGTNVRSDKMVEYFRVFAENVQIDWPTNAGMGNATKDILKQYVDNVITNLKTNRKKRLREYLRAVVYVINQQENPIFEPDDINHTIAWAIYGSESIKDNDINRDAKRYRRNLLLQIIASNSWFPVDHTNITRYTREHWFKSIQLWISMQRYIDEFNTNTGQRDQRRFERQEMRKQNRGNNKEQPSKSEKKVNKPPKVRNLAVIPICDIKRMHYPIDNYTLYKLLCQMDIVEKVKTTRKNSHTGKYERNTNFDYEFMPNNEFHWNKYFYMRKIKWFVRRKKQFRFRILSNGQAVSLQYDVEEKMCKPLDKREIVRKLENGEIPGEGGLDPGDKTWIAYVYRDVSTRKEVNITISSKQYHFMTGQNARNSKAKRWTKAFDAAAEADRNDRTWYAMMPSDMGPRWWDYVCHRLKFLERGMEVYASEKYTRLAFDQYIESNRVCDNVAGMLTNHKPCVVHMGNVDMSPNRPIRIKRHVRCPGQRKMLRSFKKCPQCYVNITDEYYTSQTCAKCFKRFDRSTRSHRFKVCTDCRPLDPRALLPSMLVGRKSKRMRRLHQLMAFVREREIEEGNGDQMDANATDPIELDTESLLSKVMLYRKNWLVNPVTGVLENVYAKRPDIDWADYQPRPHKTLWDRDIVAAKCILIKGHCDLYGYEVPETLRRPQQHQPPWQLIPGAN